MPSPALCTSLRALVSALLVVTSSTLVCAAGFVDTFATAGNFESFGGTTATVEGGVLTVTRTQANVDAGVDWRPDGTGFFSLGSQPLFRMDAASDNASINPGGQAGFYVLTAIFFNNANDYVGESLVQGDTNATGLFSYDLASIAASASIVDATQWWMRVRVQPFDLAGASFSFNEFSAVPEPASAAVLTGGVILAFVALCRRRRRDC